MKDFKTIEKINIKCIEEVINYEDLKNKILNFNYRPSYSGIVEKKYNEFLYYFYDEERNSFFKVKARPEEIANLLCERLPFTRQSNIKITSEKLEQKKLNLSELMFLYKKIGPYKFKVDLKRKTRSVSSDGLNSETMDLEIIEEIVKNVEKLDKVIREKNPQNNFELTKNIYDYFYENSYYFDSRTFGLPVPYHISEVLNSTPCEHPTTFVGLLKDEPYANCTGLSEGLVEIFRRYGIDAESEKDSVHKWVKLNMTDGTSTYIDLSKALSPTLRDSLYQVSPKLNVRYEKRELPLPKGDKNKYFLGLSTSYEENLESEEKKQTRTTVLFDKNHIPQINSQTTQTISTETSLRIDLQNDISEETDFQKQYKEFIQKTNNTITRLATVEESIIKTEQYLLESQIKENIAVVNSITQLNDIASNLTNEISNLEKALSELSMEEYKRNPMYYAKKDPKLATYKINYDALKSDKDIMELYTYQIKILKKVADEMILEEYKKFETTIQKLINRFILREVKLNPNFNVREFNEKREELLNSCRDSSINDNLTKFIV